jgi:hypothetical protein
MNISSFIEEAPIVKYISKLKSLKNLRIEALEEI